MAIKTAKIRKQPLFGANQPGAAQTKKVLGPIDKSANELKRNSTKMMSGYPDEAASDSEKGAVSGPDFSELSAAKGLSGKFGGKTAQEARTERVNKVLSLMGTPQNAEEAVADKAEGAKATYKDYKPADKSTAVVAVKKVSAVPNVVV